MSGSIVLALRLVTALALYGFLGWLMVFLYREVHRQSVVLANRRVPGISLMVRQKDASPTLRYFNQAEITVGRDPGCDLPILDDTVSARHAHLTYHHNQWWLEDLSSTNGTKLNDTLITIPTVITSGDEIRCGGTELSVSLSENVIIEPTQQIRRRPHE